MKNECSHGVEWDIDCLKCELVGLNETISHSGKQLVTAANRKIEVLELIEEQHRNLNEAAEGMM